MFFSSRIPPVDSVEHRPVEPVLSPNVVYRLLQGPRDFVARHPLLKKSLQYTAYPAIMTGSLGASYAAMQNGASPGLAFVCPGIGTAIAALALENLIPHRQDWVTNQHEANVDLAHNVLTGGLMAQSFKALTYSAFLAAGIEFSSIFGRGTSLWQASGVSNLPFLAQASIALLLGEFGGYWTHRLTHEVKSLWKWHELHHSSEKLTSLHTYRTHPVDLIRAYVFFLGLGLFGLPKEVLSFVLVSLVNFVELQHCNADLRLGPLEKLVVGPRLHRWHHSKKMAEGNHNFGSYITLFDHIPWGRIPVLGRFLKHKGHTFYLPPDREGPEQVGCGVKAINDSESPLKNWFRHVVKPFRKKPSKPLQ